MELLEANVFGILPEESSANVQTIFCNKAMLVEEILTGIILSLVSKHTKLKDWWTLCPKKLYNNLKGYKETIQRTKVKISKTVDELLIVKKVQVLLGQLNNQQVPGGMCEHRYIVPDFNFKQNILIETHSELPSYYTITIQVNHKALVDQKKASADGEDLRVFYQHDVKSLPLEIDRLVTGLYTTEAHVQFRIQKLIPSNTVDGGSYALVFGGNNVGKAKADQKKCLLSLKIFPTRH
ncbi:hypothetical protein OS493_016886 [Desmophyllum pertusum]|uniref:Uncharacterized protein n=1 Tax=Desmophyllum pertusum TaxID=174260 RepID=A0A9W9YNM1_9CNID|nr:hypothetical protein OS493_016886 [Desmophyllum pertusum]